MMSKFWWCRKLQQWRATCTGCHEPDCHPEMETNTLSKTSVKEQPKKKRRRRKRKASLKTKNRV